MRISSSIEGSTGRAIFGSPAFWLFAVATAYALYQVLFVDLDRFLAWDEAVYASEVSRFGEAVGFAAHRARGVTLIAAPPLLITDSVLAMRIYLVSVSSIGLFAAFLPWLRSIRWGAPVAAAMLATSWLSVFYGSEVMPNLYSAYAVVAAVGVAVLCVHSATTSRLVTLAVVVGLVTFLRPMDGALTMAAIAVLLLLDRSRSSVSATIYSSVGFVGGLVPWLIEAWVRFDGPVERLERASEVVGSGLTNSISEYLALLDGPISGPDPSLQVSSRGVAWLVIIVVLALTAPFVAKKLRIESLVSLFGALFLAGPYLFYTQAAAPRFMLPALGLLAVAAGIGLVGVLSNNRTGVSIVAIGSTVVILASLNLGILQSVGSEQSSARQRGLTLAEALARVTDAGSCYFLSSSGFPQLSYYSGCLGGRYDGDVEDAVALLDSAVGRGDSAHLLISGTEALAVFRELAVCEPIPGLEDRNWHICAW